MEKNNFLPFLLIFLFVFIYFSVPSYAWQEEKLELFSPKETTYAGKDIISVPFHFKINGNSSYYSIQIFENGIPIYQNSTYQKGTEILFYRNYTTDNSKINITFQILDENNIQTTKSIVFYTKILNNFNKKIQITVENTDNLFSLLVLKIPYFFQMKNNFDDIRFTYLNNYSTEEYLYYTIKEKVNGNYSIVKVYLPKENRTSNIYMYYGNQNAISESTSFVNFTYPNYIGWSDNRTYQCSGKGMMGGYNNFGAGAQTQTTISLPPGFYRISFGFIFGDSWDGETANFYINNNLTWSRNRNYGDGVNFCGINYKELFENVVVYYYHPGGSMNLKFNTTLDQAANDEWWGVDNIIIEPVSSFDPVKAIYNFNEGSGTVTYDSSEYKGYGTLINNPSWVTGKEGSAIKFDKSNDYVEIFNSKPINFTGEVTVVGWINPSSNTIDSRPIISKGGGCNRKGYLLTLLSGNKFRWHLGNGSSETNFDTQQTIPTNQWSHFAATWGNGLMNVYINGIKDSNYGLWLQGLVPNNYNVTLGDSIPRENCGFNSYEGILDNIMIFDRALSNFEINNLYLYNTIYPPPRYLKKYISINAVLNPDGTVSIEDTNAKLPITWKFIWNQTDGVLANKNYKKLINITFNNTYQFSEHEFFYNITGWKYNGEIISNENKILNSSTISSLSSFIINHPNLGEGIPIKMFILPGRRQDFSKITTVDGNAYSIFKINLTNNANAEGIPANFTNIRVLSSCEDFNCTGFTNLLETGESASGWQRGGDYGDDAENIDISTFSREGSYSLNMSYSESISTDTKARFYKPNANLGNLSKYSSGNMSLWIFIKNISTITTSIRIGIGNDAAYRSQWIIPISNLKNGWNYITIDLTSPSSSGASGPINWQNPVNYLDVVVDGTQNGSSYLLVDDWRIWSHVIPETLNLLNNENKEFWLTAYKSNVIQSIQGGANDWIQDNTKQSYAGSNGVVWIRGNVKLKNIDSIKYENVTFPENLITQKREGWECKQDKIEIFLINPNSESTSDVWPISCNKTNVITFINSSEWRQDTSKTSKANSYVFIEGNIYLNNTDNLEYKNISIIKMPEFSGRNNWNCGFNLSKVSNLSFYPLSINKTINYPIQCNKTEIIVPISSFGWKQYTGTQTIAGGTAYIEGNMKLKNYDEIPYTNILIDTNSYISSLARSDWTCNFNTPRTSYLNFLPNSENSTTNYPIYCTKSNVITKSEGLWEKYESGNLKQQWARRQINLFNTDPELTFNVNWSTSPPGGCWNVSLSTLSGLISISPLILKSDIYAYTTGDCINEVNYTWVQDESSTSTLNSQYVKKDKNLINLANITLETTYSESDFYPKLSSTSWCYFSTPNPIQISNNSNINITLRCHDSFLQKTSVSPIRQDLSKISNLTTQWLNQTISVKNNINLGFKNIQVYDSDFNTFLFTNCTSPVSFDISAYGTANATKTCYGDSINENWQGYSYPRGEIAISSSVYPITNLFLKTFINVNEVFGYTWKNINVNISQFIPGANGTTIFNIAGYDSKTIEINYSVPAPIVSSEEEFKSLYNYTKKLKITCSVGCNQLKNAKVNVSINNTYVNYKLWHNESGIWIDRTNDYNFFTQDNYAIWYIPDVNSNDYYMLNATAVFMPEYSNVGQEYSNLEYGSSNILRAYWACSEGLDKAWLETNETGLWKNYTAMNLYGNTSIWTNFTWYNSSIKFGNKVFWRIWANTTSGNVNVTPIMAFDIIDTTKPTINVYSPKNITYLSKYLTLNISANDLSGINKCLYNINDGYWIEIQKSGNYYIKEIILNDGSYKVKYNCSDLAGNINISEVYFSIDSTAPSVSIISPENNKYYNSSNLQLKYITIDAINCYYSLDNSQNITIQNCQNITLNNLSEGEHNITLFVEDQNGNKDSDFVKFYIDLTTPTLNIISPTNNSKWNTKTISLNFTSSENVICKYKINNNQFSNDFNNNITLNSTQIIEGQNNILITCYDRAENYVSKEIIIFVDTIPPSINIISPSGTYSSTTVPLNYIASDSNGISWCGYSLDNSEYITVTGNTTITTNLGTHNIKLLCNDTYNNYA
ncbi:MAG: LamG domain-containing protein, partial [Candidatus Aenigmatarchaeota archaeon]